MRHVGTSLPAYRATPPLKRLCYHTPCFFTLFAGAASHELLFYFAGGCETIKRQN